MIHQFKEFPYSESDKRPTNGDSLEKRLNDWAKTKHSSESEFFCIYSVTPVNGGVLVLYSTNPK